MENLLKIKRLDFTIPDFLRTVWTSELAREYWEPKINTISRNWHIVERLTLLQGMRPGVLQGIMPEELPMIQNWALQNNVPMVIVGLDGATESYGNASIPFEPGKKFTYRTYFGLEPERFLSAWKAQDDLSIGRMLGFPECCIKFFQRHWKEEGWRDLTIHTFDDFDQTNLVYNNVLLRHIGIRGVFHLPCSVACEPSVQIGAQIIGMTMHTGGLFKEAGWLQQLLAMPMQWTSLHGVAMVVTPILKTIYASDPLARKAILDLDSSSYPEHGARGNKFPFQTSIPLSLNGFKSSSSMRAAHQFIVSALPDIKGKVVDLGCGNGQLLQEIHAAHPNTFLTGVDSDPKVISRVVPGARYACSDIYDFRDWEEVDLTLIAIQRLFEVPEHKATALMEVISTYSERLLLYSYGEWNDEVAKLIEPYFTVVTAAKNSDYKALLLERKNV